MEYVVEVIAKHNTKYIESVIYTINSLHSKRFHLSENKIYLYSILKLINVLIY